MNTLKQDLRKRLKMELADVSDSSWQDYAKEVSNHLEAFFLERNNADLHLGLYAHMPDELSLDILDHAAIMHGFKRFLPRVLTHDSMGYFALPKGQLISSLPEHDRFGLKIPKADPNARIATKNLDVIVIPGLAFNNNGFRLGRGKGYFDIMLGAIKPHERPICIGVALDMQIIDNLPQEAHDVAVDFMCTPKRGVFKV